MAARFTAFPTIDPSLSPSQQQRIWVREAETALKNLTDRESQLVDELARVRVGKAQAEEFVRDAREALRRYEGTEQPRLRGAQRALVREVK
jgi:hypothetical protein